MPADTHLLRMLIIISNSHLLHLYNYSLVEVRWLEIGLLSWYYNYRPDNHQMSSGIYDFSRIPCSTVWVEHTVMPAQRKHTLRHLCQHQSPFTFCALSN
ncbi:hypothetical protein PVAG01_06609 [Phlyctema vagabunda]|uniref:Uncharacterized protein n=1 Tax=Phlyctema vagabunda TaxID=108571 RepID=A0ABR4PGQ1_9HELO